MARTPTARSDAGSGPSPAVAGVVLAGGSGVRVGHGRNKAYLPLGDRTAVGLSLQTLTAATLPALSRLVLVVRGDDRELAERTVAGELARSPVPVELVLGGATRHESEHRALLHLEPAIRDGAVDLVLVHDAARPLCSTTLIAELVRTAAEYGGAVPGLPAADLGAVRADGTLVPLAGTHVRIQTPQAFAAAPLLEAYRLAGEEGFDGTDTSACVERFSSIEVRNVVGDEQNFKITYPQDLFVATQYLRRNRDALR